MTTEELTEEALLDIADGIATITLNRPDHLNAWTPVMAELYRRHLDAADADPAVRAIVVTGAGRGFCAGGDMGRKAGGHETDPGRDEPFVGAVHAMAVRKPVIAAINGACAGAGLTVALHCDVRIAAAGAKFSSAFVRRGRVGSPGLPWLLVRMVGLSAAMDLMLAGRTFLAQEAYQIGLVTRMSEPGQALADALAYADELVTWSAPGAMAVLKRAIYDSLDQEYPAAVESGRGLLAASRDWPDAREGVASWTDRRPPRFAPLPPP
jgi:enoyl-CoA hydratase/carnithine racemase